MAQGQCALSESGGVTVVVPAYNASPFIEASVRSALAQTYRNLKVLVVDDGSTDDTAAICRRLAASHANLSILSGPNEGVASARNRGTRQATTPYVAYLDADDLWHPTKIERQMAELAKHARDCDWAGCYTFYRQIGLKGECLSNGANWGPSGDFFLAHLSLNHVANGSSLLVRRDVALEVGGFDEGHVRQGIGGCEDYDFQLKLLQHYKLALVPEFLVGYRTHPDQMSSNYSRMGRGLLAVLDKFAGSSGLGPEEARKARVASRSAASLEFLRGMEWRHLAEAVADILSTDPVDGGRRVVSFGIRAVRSRSIRFSKWVSSRVPLLRTPRTVTFFELDPLDGVPPAAD